MHLTAQTVELLECKILEDNVQNYTNLTTNLCPTPSVIIENEKKIKEVILQKDDISEVNNTKTLVVVILISMVLQAISGK